MLEWKDISFAYILLDISSHGSERSERSFLSTAQASETKKAILEPS